MGYMKELDIRIRNGGDDALAAALELMPRWIPVGERTPADGERVLAWDSREQSWRIAYMDGLCWYMVGFDDDTPIVASYWMPLPEPPAG